MNVTTRLVGAEQAIRDLQNVDKKVRNRVNRKAVRAGGAVFLDGLRSNAPKRNGYFKRSLTQKIKTYRRNGTVVSIIGQNKTYTKKSRKLTRRTMSGGISGRGYAAPIHFIEYGTKPHAILNPSKGAKPLKLAASQMDGQPVFVRSVRHPGTKGQQIVSKTERSTRSAVEAAVRQKIAAEMAAP